MSSPGAKVEVHNPAGRRCLCKVPCLLALGEYMLRSAFKELLIKLFTHCIYCVRIGVPGAKSYRDLCDSIVNVETHTSISLPRIEYESQTQCPRPADEEGTISNLTAPERQQHPPCSPQMAGDIARSQDLSSTPKSSKGSATATTALPRPP